ncbi:TerD family protein [Geodermatophilus sp. URMC 63]
MVDYTRRPSTPPAAPGVSLSKVTLTKGAPSVSLTKGRGAGGQMRVNLNWESGRRGLFSKGPFAKGAAVDLDLGCLWETSDGRKGVVQALGNAFGSLDRPPYVLLDGDDRSGTRSGGENLVVNLDHLDAIRRILVFAYIYEGAPDWAAANGVVTLYPQGAAPIEVRLDEHAEGARSCAIALLTNSGGALTVQREIRYLRGVQRDLDGAYGWGLDWTSGRK